MSRKPILFQATDGTNGVELWITDGTTAQTSLLIDINPGGDSSPNGFVDLGTGLVVFNATDSSGAASLWVSDGTASGTRRVSASNGANVGNPAGTIVLGTTGKAIFRATDASLGRELWVTDGTDAGTFMLKDIFPGSTGSVPVSIDLLTGGANAKALFTADNGSSGAELWVTDGTIAGTSLLKDIRSGSLGSAIRSPQMLGNGKAVFGADDGTNGLELWVTDGTAGGTSMLKNINTTAATGSGVTLTALLSTGKVLFRADDGTTNGVELWATDGTAAGTTMVKNINATANGDSNPSTPVALGTTGKAVFRANDGTTNGTELWVTNGTAAGTSMVKNIAAASGVDSNPSNFFAMSNGKVLFSADDGTTNGVELWVTDGTAAGTTMVRNINTATSGTTGSSPAGFAEASAGRVLFSAFDPTNGIELWATDGTSAGTVLVKNIAPGATGSTPTEIIAFTASDLTMALSSDTGSSAMDRVTNLANLSGLALANAVVFITEGAATVGQVTANAAGTWSFSPVLADGVHTLTATSTDTGGNAVTATLAFTLDSTAPMVPASPLVNPGFFFSGAWNWAGNFSLPNTATGWSGTAGAGVSPSGQAFWDNGYVPGGQGTTGEVGFVQSQALLQQTLSGLLVGTTYSLSFYANARAFHVGTSGSGFTVTMRNAGGTVLQTVVAPTSLTESGPAGDYSHPFTFYSGSFTASATSEVLTFAGTSPEDFSAVFAGVRLTAAPAQSVFLTSDTGSSASDGITSDPALNGTGDANAVVTILENGGTLGTATANASGIWSYTPSFAEGTHTLTAREVDLAGNTGTSSIAFTFDKTAPTVTLALGTDSGTAGDKVTNVSTLTGTAVAGSTVVIREGASTLATATANGSGTWSYAPIFADGVHTLTALSTDTAGNTGTASLTFTLDTTAPMTAASPLANPGFYFDGAWAIPGYFAGQVNVPGWSNTSNAGIGLAGLGFWDNGFLPGGQGTDGQVGFVQGLSVLQQTLSGLSVGTTYSLSFYANARAFHSGTSPATFTVTAQNGTGTVLQTIVGATTLNEAAANGDFSKAFTQYSGSFVASAASEILTFSGTTASRDVLFGGVRLVAQPGQAVFLTNDTGLSASDGITSIAALNGTGDANAVVTILENGGTLGTTTANASGIWSYTPSFAEGTHTLTAREVDLAGNTGTSSIAFTFDKTAPSVTVALVTDSGDSASDKLTNALALKGTAEANRAVVITNGALASATVTANAAGTWSYTPSLPDGSYTVTVQQTDAAGNTGSATLAFTLDTVAPSVTASLVADSGDSNSDKLTNSAALKGTAEANRAVVITNAGSPLATVTANATGSWSYTPSLLNGTYTLTAQAADAAGNTGSATVAFTLDTVAPTVTVALATDNGDSATDRLTSSATLTGTAEASRVVTILNGATTLGTTTANASGIWTFSPTLTDGSYTLTARETDAAGNTGAATIAFTLDTVAPTVTVALASDAGDSATDLLTNSAALTGTAEASRVVTILNGSTTLGTSTANASGTWSFSPTLSDGSYTLTARETDAAGNTGAATLVFTQDTAAPTVTVALSTDTGDSATDRLTSSATLTGTAEASRVVTILNGATTLGTTTANASGIWTFSPTLSDGSYTLTARETDAAGNTGAATLAFTLDAVANIAIALASDAGDSNTDRLTNNTALTGTAEADRVVTILNGATTLGTTTASSLGTWTFSPTLSDGSYTLTARETDAAGNTGAATLAFTLDTVANIAIALASDAGDSNTDRLTNNTALTGTAEADRVVTILNGATTLGTTTASSLGTWTFSPTLSDGSYTLTAQETDAAGNVGSAVLAFTQDTAAPTLTVALASDTGGSPTDRLTRSATLTGTAEANRVVTILNGATTLGTSTANASGTWAFSPTLSDGSYTLTARETDAAGNTGAATLVFTQDTTAPTVTVALASDTGDSATDRVTRSATLTGTAEANRVVTIFNGAAPLGTTTANASGIWTFSPTLTNGSYTLTARETDAAGNTGAATLAFTLDKTAPAVALALVSDTGDSATDRRTNGAALTGTAEAGRVVTILNGTATLGTTTADASGAWTFVPTLSDGAYTLTARQADAAGNTGSATLAFTLDTVANITIALASDAGDSTTDRLTKSNALSGTAEAGRVVTILNGVTTLGTTTANASGRWTFSPTLTDGSYTLTARETDAAGNVGTTTLNFTLDTASPIVSEALLFDTGDSAFDRISNSAVLSGTALADRVVTVLNGASTLGTTTADAGGNWSFAPLLADGTYTLTARQADAAGNTGSTTLAFTLDRSAPTLTVRLSVDSGSSGSDRLTNNRTIKGTTSPNGIVVVSEGDVTLGAASANASGTWSFTPSLADGSHTLTVRATDVAGNVGTSVLSFTLDREAAPTISLVEDTGDSATDNITTRIQLTGSADANSVVSIANGATKLGSVTANGSGVWNFTPSLAAGSYTLTAREADAAGNTGSATLAFTRLTSAAASADVIANRDFDLTGTWTYAGIFAPSFSVASWSGTGNAGVTPRNGAYWDNGNVGVIANSHPYAGFLQGAATLKQTVSGLIAGQSYTLTFLANGRALTGVPGRMSVSMNDPSTGGALQTVLAAADFTAVAGAGNYSVPFRRYTANFVASQASEVLTFTGYQVGAGADTTVLVDDVTLRETPTTVRLARDTGASASDGRTYDPTLTGTAAANRTVRVLNGATTLGVATADSSGNWSFTPVLADGSYSLTARQLDVAGNALDAAVTFNLDTGAPPVSISLTTDTGESAADGISRSGAIRGTANDSSVVRIREGGVVIGSTTANASGNWNYSLPIVDASRVVTAETVDTAGNIGSAILSFVQDTTAPATPPNIAPNATLDPLGTWSFPSVLNSSFTVPGWSGSGNAGVSRRNGAYWDNGRVPGQTTTEPYVGFVQQNGSLNTTLTGLTVGQAYDVTFFANARVVAGSSARFSLEETDQNGSTQSILGQTTLTPVDSLGDYGAAFNRFAGSFIATTSQAVLTFNGYSTGADTSLLLGGVDVHRQTSEPGVAIWLADDTGSDPFDGVSANASIRGSAMAGRSVAITENGLSLGTAVANSMGNWSFVPTLSEGSHTLSATETDVAGNSASATLAFVLDSRAPVVAVALQRDTGASGLDAVTNDPTLTGTADAGGSVSLIEGGTTVGTATADATGRWTLSPAISDGVHLLTAVQTDRAGNVGSAAISVNLDRSAPTLSIRLAQDTGASSSDNVSSNPALMGTAEAGRTVSIYRNNIPIGSTEADLAGNWSFLPVTAPDGASVFSVRQTDQAGNTGSASVSVTLDRVAAAQTRPELVRDSAFDVIGDWVSPGLFSASSPFLVPWWASSGNVGVSQRNGAYWDNGTVSSYPIHPYVAFIQTEGTLRQTIDQLVPGQVYTISFQANGRAYGGNQELLSLSLSSGGTESQLLAPTAIAPVDSAGNYSASFQPYEIQFLASSTSADLIFTGARAVPGADSTVLIANVSVRLNASTPITTIGLRSDSYDTRPGGDGGAGAFDARTYDRVLQGQGEPGTTVWIVEGGTTHTSATVDGFGAWSAALANSVADGAHTVTAIGSDAAGNIAEATVAFTLDSSAPAVTLALDAGPLSNGNYNSPALHGTTEAGRMVVLSEGSTPIRTLFADASGAWSYTPTTLANGHHSITATSADVAGNTAAASLSFTLAAPIRFTAELRRDSGNADSLTNDPRISGTAAAGTYIGVYYLGPIYAPGYLPGSVDGIPYAVAKATSQNTWSFDIRTLAGITVADGPFTLFATEFNTSTSVPVSFILDRAAPDVGTVSLLSDTGSSATDKVTSIGTLQGKADPGLAIKLYDGATLVGSTITDATTGAWTLSPNLTDGQHSFSAKMTDAAGNTATSAVLTATIDTTAPSLSVRLDTDSGDPADRYSNSAVLAGTAEANGTVSIAEGSIVLGSATTNAAGEWSFDPTKSALWTGNGVHSVTVSQKDKAGNASSAALKFTYDTTAAVLSAPASVSMAQGQRVAVGGIAFFDPADASGTAGYLSIQTYTATLKANNGGKLWANIGGQLWADIDARGGGQIDGAGTSTLTIKGRQSEIVANLTTLALQENSTAAGATISVNVVDQAGNAAATKTVAIDVRGRPTISVASGKRDAAVGKSSTLTNGLKIVGAQAGDNFEVVVGARAGSVYSTKDSPKARATAIELGSDRFSGSLDQVNEWLASLTTTFSQAGVQTITVDAYDTTLANYKLDSATVDYTVRALPNISAPRYLVTTQTPLRSILGATGYHLLSDLASTKLTGPKTVSIAEQYSSSDAQFTVTVTAKYGDLDSYGGYRVANANNDDAYGFKGTADQVNTFLQNLSLAESNPFDPSAIASDGSARDELSITIVDEFGNSSSTVVPVIADEAPRLQVSDSVETGIGWRTPLGGLVSLTSSGAHADETRASVLIKHWSGFNVGYTRGNFSLVVNRRVTVERPNDGSLILHGSVKDLSNALSKLSYIGLPQAGTDALQISFAIGDTVEADLRDPRIKIVTQASQPTADLLMKNDGQLHYFLDSNGQKITKASFETVFPTISVTPPQLLLPTSSATSLGLTVGSHFWGTYGEAVLGLYEAVSELSFTPLIGLTATPGGYNVAYGINVGAKIPTGTANGSKVTIDTSRYRAARQSESGPSVQDPTLDSFFLGTKLHLQLSTSLGLHTEAKVFYIPVAGTSQDYPLVKRSFTADTTLKAAIAFPHQESVDDTVESPQPTLSLVDSRFTTDHVTTVPDITLLAKNGFLHFVIGETDTPTPIAVAANPTGGFDIPDHISFVLDPPIDFLNPNGTHKSSGSAEQGAHDSFQQALNDAYAFKFQAPVTLTVTNPNDLSANFDLDSTTIGAGTLAPISTIIISPNKFASFDIDILPTIGQILEDAGQEEISPLFTESHQNLALGPYGVEGAVVVKGHAELDPIETHLRLDARQVQKTTFTPDTMIDSAGGVTTDPSGATATRTATSLKNSTARLTATFIAGGKNAPSVAPQQTINGELGDRFSFTTPASGAGVMVVDASYSIQGTVSARMGVNLQAYFTVKAIYADLSLSLQVAGYDVLPRSLPIGPAYDHEFLITSGNVFFDTEYKSTETLTTTERYVTTFGTGVVMSDQVATINAPPSGNAPSLSAPSLVSLSSMQSLDESGPFPVSLAEASPPVAGLDAPFVVVGAGGTAVIASGAATDGDVIAAGGIEYIRLGGAAYNAVVYPGGSQIVEDGAWAFATRLDGGGTQTVLAGGVASDTAVDGGTQDVFGMASQSRVSAGGTLIVEDGGTATGAIIAAGGTLVLTGTGLFQGGVVQSGATVRVGTGATLTGLLVAKATTFEVAAGGTSISAHVADGGHEIVDADGADTGVTVDLGGVLEVSGTSRQATIAIGGLMSVTAEGEAVEAHVFGTQNIVAGGKDLRSKIGSNGVQLVSGSASGVSVEAGGWQYVGQGGTAEASAVGTGGYQFVDKGGSESGSVFATGASQLVVGSASGDILNGGTQVVAGAVDAVAINTGGLQIVGPTGVAAHSVINLGGLQRVTGTATDATVNGGAQIVSAGGSVSKTTMSAGSVSVLAGGTASYTTVNGGELSVLGIARDSIARTSGSITVGALGSVVASTIEAGGILQVGSGGIASGTKIGSGGVETVLADGYDGSVVIVSGGLQNVYGIATGATVSGGEQIVGAGGQAQGSRVDAGGALRVGAGGQVVGALIGDAGVLEVLSGGASSGADIRFGASEIVAAGGSDNHARIAQGGVQSVAGVASNTDVAGGLQNVAAGGSTSAVLLSDGGIQEVYGLAMETRIDSGLQLVWSGGVASGTSIGATGTMHVFAGGMAHDITFAGPGGALILNDPAGLTGVITGWQAGSIIDFAGTAVSAAYADGSVLTVVLDGGASYSYALSGGSNALHVGLSDDGTGGTALELAGPYFVVPESVSVGIGQAGALGQIMFGAAGAAADDVFVVDVSAAHGTLSAPGAAGEGTSHLTLSGTSEQIGTALAALSLVETGLGGDVVTFDAMDSQGLSASRGVIGVSVVDVPSLRGPAASVVGLGQGAALTNLSLSQPAAPVNAKYSVELSNAHATLTAIGAGVSGTGTTHLTLTGSLSDVNTMLATVSFSGIEVGSDAIVVSALDSFGNAAETFSIALRVAELPVIIAPDTTPLVAGIVRPVPGVVVTDPGAPAGAAYTVTLESNLGVIFTSGAGAAGAGASTLRLSGSLEEVNAELATLAVMESAAGSDAISISVSTGEGVASAPRSVALETIGAPRITPPAAITTAAGRTTLLSGASITQPGAVTGASYTVKVSDGSGLLSVLPGSAFVAGNGSTALTIQGDIGAVNDALATLSVETVAPGEDALTVAVTDDAGASGSAFSQILVNATPIIVAPDQVRGVAGSARPVLGLGLSESGLTADMSFSVSITSNGGVLQANTGNAVVSGLGSTTLAISGTLSDVSAVLDSLTVTEAAPGVDTITIAAADSFGQIALPASIAVEVNGLPELSAPNAIVTAVGRSNALSGAVLTEVGDPFGIKFTVTISDAAGLLSVVPGTSTVLGNATNHLTISGPLASVGDTLSSLSITGVVAGIETVNLSVADSLGGSATTSTSVVVNGLPVVQAPSSAVLGVGKAGGIAGVSITQTGNTAGETFWTTVSDTWGDLFATAAGTASVSGNGTKTLVVSGSLLDVNATLFTLSDLSAIVGPDTITVSAVDSFGNTAATDGSVSIVVNGLPTVTAPSTLVVGVGKAATVGGVSIAEAGETSSVVFTATVAAVAGALSATAKGAAAISGNGGKTVTVSGSLADVNATLATLSDLEALPGADTLTISAIDGFGNAAAVNGSVTVTVNGLPTVAAPAKHTLGVGRTGAITGVSIAESGDTTAPMFTATVSNTSGMLAVVGAGQAALTGNGGKTVTIQGTLTDVNATLASLTDTSTSLGSDTITISATDSFGNAAATNGSIATTVNGTPTITAPTAVTLGMGKVGAIPGVAVAETGDTSGVTFTVVISDAFGLLSVANASPAMVSGNGSASVTVSGALVDVNATLATLSDVQSTAGADTIVVSASDSLGNVAATMGTTAVTVNGRPTVTAPSTATLGVGRAGALTGISIAEAGNTAGLTFTAAITDKTGQLTVVRAGTATVTGNGSKNVTVSGSLSDVNATLATLTGLGSTPGSDTVTITAVDSFGNDAAVAASVALTINGLPVVTVPGSQVVSTGKAAAIGGVSLSETGNTTGELFIATVTAIAGSLVVTKSGSASIAGNVSRSVTIAGSLADVNATLASLTVIEATVGLDTLSVGATDSFGNNATTSGSVALAATSAAQPTIIAKTPNTTAAATGSGQQLVSQATGQTLTGSSAGGVTFLGGADTRVSAAGGGNTIIMAAGNHTISMGTNGNTLSLGDGNNTISGSGTGNSVTGGTGNNTITGFTGTATITLGNGNNTITIAGAGNRVTVGTGTNKINAGTGGNENVRAGDGANTVTVGGANNVVTLGNGVNSITSTGAAAAITAGNGGNSIVVTGSGSGITTGSGNDTITATVGGQMIRAGLGINAITFAGSGNVIYNQGGTDTLTDKGFNNTIVLPSAGAGLDIINGPVMTNNDIFDLRAALAVTSWDHTISSLGNFLSLGLSGSNAIVSLNPTGIPGGAASTIAVLNGSGPVSLNTFLSHSLVL